MCGTRQSQGSVTSSNEDYAQPASAQGIALAQDAIGRILTTEMVFVCLLHPSELGYELTLRSFRHLPARCRTAFRKPPGFHTTAREPKRAHLRVILAYMCVKLQMRLYVCQAPCPFWVHFGSILGPFWVHFGSILGPFWVHFGSILGPFWVHFWSILGPFWVHFGSILGPFCLLSVW